MTLKKLLLALVAVVLVTDIAVFLDLPVLRQILGFFCFAILPGLLLLYTFRLGEMSFLKKFALSVGLSLSFLLFLGLLVNYLLPLFGLTRPLATYPLVISLTVALALLLVLAYLRNKGITSFAFNFNAEKQNKSLPLLLFPLLFPFLSVLGRNLADIVGDSRVITALFLSIPLYVILLVWQNQKAPAGTYPLAIMMISLSLLLSRGLISNYLVGGDIYSEYHFFQEVSQNQRWSITVPGQALAASLSITLLPAVFESLLDVSSLYIYKVVLLLLISLVPVIGYIIYQRYLEPLYAFLASFFFVSQIPFIYLLSGNLRVGVAQISFSLVLMVLLDEKLGEFKRRLLFLIFLASVVVEYYVTPVILLLLTASLWLISEVSRGKSGRQILSPVAGVLLPVIFIYLWWGQVESGGVINYVFFFERTVFYLSQLFIAELRAPDVTSLFALTPYTSLLMQIPSIIQRLTFITIGIGAGYMLLKKEWRGRFRHYGILVAVSFILLLGEIIFPWVSFGYGASRLYLQLLVILAPAFIVGGQAISDATYSVYRFLRSKAGGLRFRYQLSSPAFLPAIVVIVAISQFFSSSFLLHPLVGLPGREIIDSKSSAYLALYVHESEVRAARWLGANNLENRPVYLGNLLQPGSGDIFEYTEYGLSRNFEVYGFARETFQENSFIFLKYSNLTTGEVNSPYIRRYTAQLAEFAPQFAGRNKIYSNGKAVILK